MGGAASLHSQVDRDRQNVGVAAATRRSHDQQTMMELDEEVVVTDEVTAEDKRRALLWYKLHLTMDEDIELQELLVEHRSRLEHLRKLSWEQQADLAKILAHPPEDRLTMLRDKKEWERILLQAGALRTGASGVVGPGPRQVRMAEYNANKTDILLGKMRISHSTGKVVPAGVDARQAQAPLARTEELTETEKEERKAWLRSLPVIGQRARIEDRGDLEAEGAQVRANLRAKARLLLLEGAAPNVNIQCSNR